MTLTSTASAGCAGAGLAVLFVNHALQTRTVDSQMPLLPDACTGLIVWRNV